MGGDQPLHQEMKQHDIFIFLKQLLLTAKVSFTMGNVVHLLRLAISHLPSLLDMQLPTLIFIGVLSAPTVSFKSQLLVCME